MVKLPEYYPWSSYYLFKESKLTAPGYMNINSKLDYFLYLVRLIGILSGMLLASNLK